MSDLRALLGDRYDDVIGKALIAADKGGYYVTRGYIDEGDVDKILAAVLPDLLADVWEEGHWLGKADAATNAVRVDGQYVQSVNPYRQPEGNRA